MYVGLCDKINQSPFQSQIKYLNDSRLLLKAIDNLLNSLVSWVVVEYYEQNVPI